MSSGLIETRRVGAWQITWSTVQYEPRSATAPCHLRAMVSAPRNGPSYMPGGK